MLRVLDTVDDDLIEGMVVGRPNRFVLNVRFEGGDEEVFLADPGALEVVSNGSTVLCRRVDDPDRETDYDAIAVEAGDFYVSLRAAFAETLFETAFTQSWLPAFEGYDLVERQPELPDHGRGDFLFAAPEGSETFVEIKSCTHATDGIGKFPDRPTERGRRHLESLAEIAESGSEAHLVFVAQRPDIDVITPYREIDPDFADLLLDVTQRGVALHGIVTEFQPPEYLLRKEQIPVRLS